MEHSNLSRRSFLARTATTVAVLGFPTFIPSSALGKDGAVAPSNRITIGGIGVGGRGKDILRAMVGARDAQVLALCDPYKDRRQESKQFVDRQAGDSGCSVYSDYREVLARKDIDAVFIAAQDHWHALIATAAAAQGKDMYCEKPLGTSVRESQAIRDAVRRHGRVFQTGTQQRSETNFRVACELARNGYLGRIHTVEVAAPGPAYRPAYKGPFDPQPVPEGFEWDMWLGPAPRKPYNPGRVAWPDWYLIWDYCAGFIVNWGVHHLDIALWGCPQLAEEPFEVECQATYRKEGFTDNVNGWKATFTYPSGLKMIFTDETGQETGCRFIGDQGWVYADRGRYSAEPEVLRPESLSQFKFRDSDIRLHRSENHALDFLQSVRSRRDPVSDVDAGHRASCFGMIADIAGRLERKVKWDPKKEEFIDDPEATALLTRPMRDPWSKEMKLHRS
ncbi:MAG: Gfo/Idh/MocA family protein [Verrucomicrobiia bacterium]